jgi:hypothetical protein
MGVWVTYEKTKIAQAKSKKKFNVFDELDILSGKRPCNATLFFVVVKNMVLYPDRDSAKKIDPH